MRTLMGESSLFDTHSMVVRNVCEARGQGQGGAREGDKRMGDEKRGKERPRRKNAKTKRRDKDKEENEEEKKEKDNGRRKERRKDTGRTTKKIKAQRKKEASGGTLCIPRIRASRLCTSAEIKKTQSTSHLTSNLRLLPAVVSIAARRVASGFRDSLHARRPVMCFEQQQRTRRWGGVLEAANQRLTKTALMRL